MSLSRPGRLRRLVAVLAGAGLAAGLSAGVALAALSAGGKVQHRYEPLAPAADQEQLAMLDDGIATDAERAAAAENAAKCMRAAGLHAEVEPGLHAGIGIHGALGASGEALVKQCAAAHLDRVAVTWADQNRPDAAIRRRVAESTTACFVANGGVPENPVLTSDEVRDILMSGSNQQAAALGACLQANMERFGFAF